MSDSIPLYLVGSPDGRLASVATVLGDSARVLASDEEWAALGDRPPGVLVFDADAADAGLMLDALGALPAEHWTVAVVSGGDPPSVRTLSLGARDSLEDVRGYATDPASAPGCLLDLDRALAAMARVRHDLNNPLTAAMAEAQLLLMEAPEGEDRESLEAILQQLRRMRDMLSSSRYLRPRRD